MSSDSSPSKMDRRGFVKIVTTFLSSIMGAVLALPLIQYFISPALGKSEEESWIPLGELESYPLELPTPFYFTRSKTNGWEKSSQSYGVFVLRQAGDQVTVFSDVCTHLSCRISWDEDIEQYYCPCHAAFFAKNGEVVSGPPPRPLDQYQTKIENNQLFILLREG